MKNVALKIVLLLLVISLPLASISAFQGEGRGKMKMKFKMMKELNLSEEQKAKMESFKIEHQKFAADIHADIQKMRLDIKEMLNGKKVDEAKVLNLTGKISQQQAKLKEDAVKTWFKTYNILDEKQKELWLKTAGRFLDNMGPKMMQRGMKGCMKEPR